jgi:hypothetical protein
MQRAITAPLWRVFAERVLALLTVGILPFHDLLFPLVNALTVVCLARCDITEIGRSVLDALRAPLSLPVSARWRLMEAALLLVGGATGALVVFSAIALGNQPQWILGDVIMALGTLATVAIGGYLAQRTWRRWYDARSVR